jgi:outer membrane protein W
MTAKQHFFLYFFLIIAVPTFSQITKGAKSISSANLSYQSSSQTYTSGSNSPYESSNYSINFFVNSPYYMVSNRLQMGLGLGLGFQKNDNYEGGNQPKALYGKSLTLSPDVTYYFTKNSKGFYANIGGEYNPFEYKTVNKQSNITESTNSDYFYKAHIGVGYLKPINDNVFFNYLLDYERSNIVNYVGLSAGFSNIVQSILGKKSEETPQFIEAGRSIISGSFNARYYDFGEGSISIGGYFERLKFKNSNFAFGFYGGGSALISPNSTDYYSLSGGTKARYYIPMSKRWYIYPELGLGLSFNRNFNQSRTTTNFDLVLAKGVGLNYFITKNIALDVNVAFGVRSNKTTDSQQLNKTSNVNGSINMGAIYFIDKLF